MKLSLIKRGMEVAAIFISAFNSFQPKKYISWDLFGGFFDKEIS